MAYEDQQEIQLIIEDQDQNLTLIIEELNLTGGIRAAFEIEMLPPESEPEVVANLSDRQAMYTLRIPRGLTGANGEDAQLDIVDPVVYFENKLF